MVCLYGAYAADIMCNVCIQRVGRCVCVCSHSQIECVMDDDDGGVLKTNRQGISISGKCERTFFEMG